MSERRAFGERLRRQRERQHVTLSEIAEATKVLASHFAGLERGDCSRWPGGMYNRSFIRGYAKAIGLDPDETAAEFAEYYDPPPQVPATQQPAPAPSEKPVRPALRLSIESDPDAGQKRAVRITALIVVDLLAIVALAAAGVLFTAASFWISLAAASIGYQIVSRVARSVPRTALRSHSATPELSAEATAEGDVTVSSTASIIA
jgi:cytoskeletal protein RodZ